MSSIFADLFFPGNPERRRLVTELQIAIKGDFNNYKQAWNKLIALLNEGFRESPQVEVRSIQLIPLRLSIEFDSPEACAAEIKATFEDLQSKFELLGKLINLPEGWENAAALSGSGLRLNVEYLQNICNAISVSLGVTAAAFVVWFVFSGVVAWGKLAATAVSGIGSVVIVILLDMIVGAITGAIERKELEKAITNLKKMRETTLNLSVAALEINTIVQNIEKAKQGIPYTIDEDHMIRWNKTKKSYEVVNFNAMTVVATLAMAA